MGILRLMRRLFGYVSNLWKDTKFLIRTALVALGLLVLGGWAYVANKGVDLLRDTGRCALSPWRCLTGELNRPPVPPAQRLAESNKNCLKILAADDGVTKIQHMFWAHAALNLADKTGLTICEIHKRKRTLKAPSEWGSEWPRYPAAAKRLDDNSVSGDTGNVAQADLEVERVLVHRTEDYEKFPCLRYVLGGIRPAKWGTTQDESKFEAEMELLYADGDARFYGPKGSPKCK